MIHQQFLQFLGIFYQCQVEGLVKYNSTNDSAQCHNLPLPPKKKSILQLISEVLQFKNVLILRAFFIRKLHNIKTHFSFRFLHVYKLKMSYRIEQNDNDIFFIWYMKTSFFHLKTEVLYIQWEKKIMKNAPVQVIFTDKNQ